MTIPDRLPLFPLDMVAFPGEVVPLHIFEPRYKQMIQDVESGDQLFGIVPVVSGKVMETGTTMALTGIVNRYPDGRLDILAEGVGGIRILEFYPQIGDRWYPGGLVSPLGDLKDARPEDEGRLVELVRELWGHLGIDKDLPRTGMPDLVWRVAHFLGLGRDQEYLLLCLSSERSRQEWVLDYLERWMPQVRRMGELRRMASQNGHFRQFPPAEWA